jgi:hypothetical protein
MPLLLPKIPSCVNRRCLSRRALRRYHRPHRLRQHPPFDRYHPNRSPPSNVRTTNPVAIHHSRATPNGSPDKTDFMFVPSFLVARELVWLCGSSTVRWICCDDLQALYSLISRIHVMRRTRQRAAALDTDDTFMMVPTLFFNGPLMSAQHRSPQKSRPVC